MIAVDWSNLHVAGAFLFGSAFGTIATLRIVRYVTTYFAHAPPRDDPPPTVE